MIQLVRLPLRRTALLVRCDHCQQRIYGPERGWALYQREQPEAPLHFVHIRCAFAYCAHRGGYLAWRTRQLATLSLDLFQPGQQRAVRVADFLLKRGAA